MFQSKTADVPNFPYTETPVLPPDVYVKGLTSKLGYQHVSGSDPIFVVKAPVFYRTKPPGVPLPMGLNRSTWILVNGVWSQVEDNVAPPAQAERFEQWVERACFQWHSPDGKVIPLACSPRVSDAIPLGSHRVPQAVPTNASERRDPQLQFSTEELFSDKGLHHHYTSLADLTVPCGRVINTLVRLVHGGSHGTGFRSDTRSRRYPTTTNMAIERTQNCDQSDIEDEIISHEVNILELGLRCKGARVEDRSFSTSDLVKILEYPSLTCGLDARVAQMAHLKNGNMQPGCLKLTMAKWCIISWPIISWLVKKVLNWTRKNMSLWSWPPKCCT